MMPAAIVLVRFPLVAATTLPVVARIAKAGIRVVVVIVVIVVVGLYQILRQSRAYGCLHPVDGITAASGRDRIVVPVALVGNGDQLSDFVSVSVVHLNTDFVWLQVHPLYHDGGNGVFVL